MVLAYKNHHTSSQSIKWIEGVKTLSMLWIAWYHIDQLIISPSQGLNNQFNIAHLGFAGVHVFLIISGFGLTISLAKIKKENSLKWQQLPWKKFYIRRLLLLL